MTEPAQLSMTSTAHFKDQVLDRLAEKVNVAQFVSFGPGPEPRLRHVRIHGYPRDLMPRSVDESVRTLIETSLESSVNVRSFDPEQPKAHDFLYGLTDLSEVVAAVNRLASRGLHTIVNETIDVNDGGVSGVCYAGLIEFAPEDTPRCVEKPGTAMFPRDLGLRVLETVYGFRPALDYKNDLRVEFSIHPLRRGFRHEHTIIWEMERAESVHLSGEVAWPNRFSRFLGDKTFGLLVADGMELHVPRTTVISRRLPPFSFGRPTGSVEPWIRTSPTEQVPGRFTTRRGWLDPFRLIATEDPEATRISSILAQEGVEAAYSGASVVAANGEVIVEGVAGSGEDFMQGRVMPESLPPTVVADIRSVHQSIAERLGAVRFEWAHDGATAWVVQLHRGATSTVGRVLYPGEPTFEHRFPVDGGLEALRLLIGRVEGTGAGIVLVGNVGVTSHLGDVLRRARIPSRIEPIEVASEVQH